MKKRLLSMLLVLVMVLGMFPMSAMAVEEDTSWYSESENAFEISTAAQLRGLASLVNAGKFGKKTITITLKENIDLGSENWVPIGTESNPFFGTFDGDYHTISNLNYNGESNCVGLFGCVEASEIKNLVIGSGTIITTGEKVGSIVGYVASASTISNCGSYCDVQGSNYVGGIFGSYRSGGNVTCQNVFNAGDIKTNTIGGGIAGRSRSIKNAYNTGKVTAIGGSADVKIGGIAGELGAAKAKLTNCYTSGTVTASSGSAYLMVGSRPFNIGQQTNSNAIFDTCFYLKDGNMLPVGEGVSTATTNTVTGIDSAEEMKQIAASLGENFEADNTESPINGGYPILKWQKDIKAGSDEPGQEEPGQDEPNDSPYWVDHAATEFAGGTGTYNDPYLVATAEQLVLVAIKASENLTHGEDYKPIYFKQTADIDLGDRYWPGIGTNASRFRGCYDGGNYEIKNLKMESTADYGGLFGYILGARLINIRLRNVNVSGKAYIGALVGASESSDIANCHVLSGNVTGSGTRVGGLVGAFKPKSENTALDYVMDCSSAAKVTGSSAVGGLIGGIWNSVTGNNRVGNVLIKNCCAVGDVTCTGTKAGVSAGGLVGGQDPTKKVLIEHCYASGAVTGTAKSLVGGLVGNSGFGTNYKSDNAVYQGNVALSPSLSGLGEGYVYGRIAGLGNNLESSLSVRLKNNYALDSMTLGGVTVACDDTASYNGASLSAAALAEQNTWAEIGFDFSTEGGWQWDGTAMRPVLKGTLCAYPVVITTQPLDSTAYSNRNVTFTVEAGEGIGELTYTWQSSVDQGATWEEVSGSNGNTLIPTGDVKTNGVWFRCKITDPVTGAHYYSSPAVLTVVDSAFTPQTVADELYAVYQKGLVSTAKAPSGLYSISENISDQDVMLYYLNDYDIASVLAGSGLPAWGAIDWMVQGHDPAQYLKIGKTSVQAEEVDLIDTFLDMQTALGTGAFVNTNNPDDKDFIMSNLYYFLALDIYYQGAGEWANENQAGTAGRDAAIKYLLSLLKTDRSTDKKYYSEPVRDVVDLESNIPIRNYVSAIYACDFVTVMSRIADDSQFGEEIRAAIYDTMYLLDNGMLNATDYTVPCAKYLSALVAAAKVAEADETADEGLADEYKETAADVFETLMNARASDGTYSLVTKVGVYDRVQSLPEDTGNAIATAAVAMALGDYAKERALVAEMNYQRSEEELFIADMNRIELPEVVLTDLTLPAKGFNGTTLVWSSTNTSVIGADGKVTRPEADTAVVLTVTGTLGEANATRQFTVTVPAQRMAGGDEAYADAANLKLLPEYLADIELPTSGANGTTITWASSNTDVIANDGKVTRPAIDEEDAVVTLTATITKGEASETKAFTVKVWANVDTSTKEGKVKEAYYHIRQKYMTTKVLQTYWDAWIIYAALGEDAANFDYVYNPGHLGTSLGGNILAIMCMGDNPYNLNGVNYIELLEKAGVTGGTWAEPTFRIMAAEAAGMGHPGSNDMSTQMGWFDSIQHGADLAGWASVPVSRHIDDDASYRPIIQSYMNAISTNMAGGDSADKALSAGCVITGLTAFYAADLKFDGIEGMDVTTDMPWVNHEWLEQLYKRVMDSLEAGGDGFSAQVMLEFCDLYNTLYNDGNVTWISCGVNKDKLDAQIAKANAILENKTEYTEASINAIEAALAIVNAISAESLAKEIADYGEEYYTLYDAVRYAKRTDAPVVDETALNEAKAAAVKAVEDAFAEYDQSNYSLDNWNELVRVKNAGLALIVSAEDEAAVAKAKNDALVAMAAVPVKGNAPGGNTPGGNNTITVYFTLLGDEIHYDEEGVENLTGETHTLKSNNLDTWVAKKAYTVDSDATVWDVVMKVLRENGMTWSNPTGNYLESITRDGVTIGEFDNGNDSGWMYTLNGHHSLLGVGEQYLVNGDNIVLHYTDDFTVEEGSEPWYPSTGGDNIGAEDRAAAREVKGLIEAIGTVTKDSGDAIKAARAAYDALTDAQKDLVPNYEDLVAAEKKYAELTGKLVFTDVAEDAYYLNAVKWAVEKGITNGTSDTTFSPNASCTRAQMVTFLWRAAGEPKAKSTTPAFTDVDKDAYYYEALLWAIENGITNGTSDSTFSPDAVCNRGQMATFLYRSAKTPSVSGSHDFADVKADAYYNDAVIWAADQKITNGTSDTTFSPDADCTRGQMVTFLYRYLAK